MFTQASTHIFRENILLKAKFKVIPNHERNGERERDRETERVEKKREKERMQESVLQREEERMESGTVKLYFSI